MVRAQIISKLATDGHDDSHNQMGKCRNYADLDMRGEKHEKHFVCKNNYCETSGEGPSTSVTRRVVYCFIICVETSFFMLYAVSMFGFYYLAYLKSKHLLKVCRLADEEQVESPTSAEISHNNSVHWHGGEEGPPWCVELLQDKKVLLTLEVSIRFSNASEL